MQTKRIKILHCADVHIGALFRNIGLKAEKRRAEVKDTFLDLINKCREENIDLMLISGDLFDDVTVSEGTVNEIKSALGNINTKVVISPGNHDPFSPGCPYDGEWPGNVTIFKSSSMQSFKLDDLGVRIWGCAFTGMYQNKQVLADVKVPDDDLINICIMHGSVSSDTSGMYAPVTTGSIALSGMDYIALGHIHKRTPVMKAGNTYYAYPGCLEGKGFDELGEKGFYKGIISKGYCNLTFERMCRRINAEFQIDISGCTDTDSCVRKICSEMKRLYGTEYAENLYKVILKGDTSEDMLPHPEDIESRLSNMVFYIKVIDTVQIDISEEKLIEGDDLRGIFIRRMKEKILCAVSEHERDIARHALKIGIKAFSGEVRYNDYYKD